MLTESPENRRKLKRGLIVTDSLSPWWRYFGGHL